MGIPPEKRQEDKSYRKMYLRVKAQKQKLRIRYSKLLQAWTDWYHQHGSAWLKKHAECPLETQGKRAPMTLIDLNEERPKPPFEEGSSMAALEHDDPPQPGLFGKGTLLFRPGSQILALRSGGDGKVSREIEDDRPKVQTKKLRVQEGGDREVSEEDLVCADTLCSIREKEMQRPTEIAGRPRVEVEVMRHREEGAHFYGTKEETLNEMVETDRRIYKEDLNVFYKDSGTPPAKLNWEDVATIEEKDILQNFANFTMTSPIQFAAVLAKNLKTPDETKRRVLKCFLKVGREDEDEVRPNLSMETGGRPLARTPSESTIVVSNSSRPIFHGSSSKLDKGKGKLQQVVEDKESAGESDGSPSP